MGWFFGLRIVFLSCQSLWESFSLWLRRKRLHPMGIFKMCRLNSPFLQELKNIAARKTEQHKKRKSAVCVCNAWTLKKPGEGAAASIGHTVQFSLHLGLNPRTLLIAQLCTSVPSQHALIILQQESFSSPFSVWLCRFWRFGWRLKANVMDWCDLCVSSEENTVDISVERLWYIKNCNWPPNS